MAADQSTETAQNDGFDLFTISQSLLSIEHAARAIEEHPDASHSDQLSGIAHLIASESYRLQVALGQAVAFCTRSPSCPYKNSTCSTLTRASP